jgi:hypothetical protein
MPKLYEYLGIILFFYSNEHEPVHVHARKGEFETKAEIIIVDGEIDHIAFDTVKGRKPLPTKDLNNLKVFLEHFANEIVQKWVDYFVYNKDIEFKRITKKL